jgi:hypothetical protein
MRAAIAAARQALDQTEHTWGVWADSVRQDVEARHGVDYEPDDQVILKDPEYSRALDVRLDLDKVKHELATLIEDFDAAESWEEDSR